MYTFCICTFTVNDHVCIYSESVGVYIFIMLKGFTCTLTMSVDVCSLPVTLYEGVSTVFVSISCYSDVIYMYTLCVCICTFTCGDHVCMYSDSVGVYIFIMLKGFTCTLTMSVDVCSLTVFLYTGVSTVFVSISCYSDMIYMYTLCVCICTFTYGDHVCMYSDGPCVLWLL